MSCSGHGDFLDGKCYCDAGWFNDTCDESLKIRWSEAYYFYFGSFIGFFAIMALLSTRTLFAQLEDRSQMHYKTGCSFICLMLQSPVNVCITFCLIFCLIKIAWLAIDPFQMNGILDRVYERLLAEIVYSFLFAIYGVLLIVWYTLYDEVSYNTKEETKGRTCIWGLFKCFLKFRIIMVFVIQIVISIVKGLRLSSKYRYYSYSAYGVLYLNFVLFIIEFTVYGVALYRCIDDQLKASTIEFNSQKEQAQQEIMVAVKDPNVQKQPVDDANSSKPLVQFQEQMSPIAAKPVEQPDSVAKSDSEDPKNIMKRSRGQQYSRTFSRRGKESQVLYRQDSFSKGKTDSLVPNPDPSQVEQDVLHTQHRSFRLEENEEVIDWHDEDLRKTALEEIQNRQMAVVKNVKLEIQMRQKKKSAIIHQSQRSFQRQDNLALDQRELKIVEEEVKQYVQVSDILQTQAQFYSKREHLNLDKRVLQKILMLIVLGVLLEVGFAVLSVVIYVSTLLQRPTGTLVVMYVVGVLEVLSLAVVLKLFQDIKCKEIENLIWIKKIGHKNNKINQKYSFSIPKQLKEGDPSKQRFEKRINQC